MEDQRRTEIYREQFQRENSKLSFASIESYLASLEIEISIGINVKEFVPRIAQLTQKTNQFNLTTKRYAEVQIEDYMDSSASKVYSLSVKDKFGDNGLTGVCIVTEDGCSSGEVIIDTLLMSCRIIGRNIEYAFLNSILTGIFIEQFEQVRAAFLPTPKNSQVEKFYEKAGFSLVDDINGSKSYILRRDAFKPTSINYVKYAE
jgi:FkbH-like protein